VGEFRSQSSTGPKPFLTADHPDAYIDHPAPADRLARWREVFPKTQDPHVCPKCKGYGGHNLEVNAYPLREGMEDTPENRHKYCHFRSACNQCVGWGYVTDKRDAECVHESGPGTRTNFNCVTNYCCTKCGKAWSVDSSG
jgi:hypothetical protein